MGGYLHRVAEVDLSTGKVRELQPEEETLVRFIGGSGLGAKILRDRAAYGIDPLDPASPLIFMTGPFANTPVFTSGRHQVVARSPLTGYFGESDAGGTWGPALKRAGFDGVIVTGKAATPVYLWICQGKIEIRSAEQIWGLDTMETDAAVRSATTDKATVACIGPAGEKLVRLAAIINDGKAARAAGRCGLGAVMGAKNLKAIAVWGDMHTPVHDASTLQAELKALARDLREQLVGLTKFGTSGGLASFERMGALPLQNWKGSQRWTEGAMQITGATMAESMGAGNYGCERCIIRCGREIKVTDGPYAGLAGAGPEYETLASLGSLCLVSDLGAVAKGNDLCNRYGIDTISVGAAVAFAMEAYERGLITAADTDGLELRWGDGAAMVQLVQMIGENRGFGAVLAGGVRQAAKSLGPEADEFAIHVKGLEYPMHEPRAYMSLALAYATSSRGACHLAGLSHIFERSVTLPDIGVHEVLDRMNPEGKAELVAVCQNLMGMFDSLKACKLLLFGGVGVEKLSRWYHLVTGKSLDAASFLQTGERIFNLKRLFNLRCGMDPGKEDCAPRRILELPKEAEGWQTRLPPLAEMLPEYYRCRGWDESGRPTPAKVEELGLQQELGSCREGDASGSR